MKLSQKPQVLPHQHLLSQPQPFTPSSQTALPSSTRQMLPPQPPTTPAALLSRHDRPSVSRHPDVAPGGHSMPPMSSSDPCHFAGSQNADLGRLESHTAASFPNQIVNNSDRTQGWRSGGTGQKIWKRRGRSPRHRGAETLQLAVSSRHLKPTCIHVLMLIASELGSGPNGNRQSPTRGSTIWPHS